MLHLLSKLHESFEKALDQWFAEALGEPRTEAPPHLSSGMILSQDSTTITVYTVAHIMGFSEYIPPLIDLLKKSEFEDAPHILDYAIPLQNAADTVVIAENPPGNFRLDKMMVARLRKLAEMILPYQNNLCTLNGLIDAAQMLCQNYHLGIKNSYSCSSGQSEFLPKGYN